MITFIGDMKMRIDIKKTSVYSFDELSDDVKQTAIERFANINTDFEWWNCIYEDAANVGITLTEFDPGRSSYCHGDIDDAEETANKILKEHGASCETYMTAQQFMIDTQSARETFEKSKNDDPKYEEFEDTGELDDLIFMFEDSILEDYRIMLQKEYEYLTSEETIIETIEANKYEFTVDGRLYR